MKEFLNSETEELIEKAFEGWNIIIETLEEEADEEYQYFEVVPGYTLTVYEQDYGRKKDLESLLNSTIVQTFRLKDLLWQSGFKYIIFDDGTGTERYLTPYNQKFEPFDTKDTLSITQLSGILPHDVMASIMKNREGGTFANPYRAAPTKEQLDLIASKLYLGQVIFLDEFAGVYTKVFPQGYTQIKVEELIGRIRGNLKNYKDFPNSVLANSIAELLGKGWIDITEIDFATGEIITEEVYEDEPSEKHWSQHFHYFEDLSARFNAKKKKFSGALYESYRYQLNPIFNYFGEDGASFHWVTPDMENVATISVTNERATIHLDSNFPQVPLEPLIKLLKKTFKPHTVDILERSFTVRSVVRPDMSVNSIILPQPQLAGRLFEYIVANRLSLGSDMLVASFALGEEWDEVTGPGAWPNNAAAGFGELITRWGYLQKGHDKKMVDHLKVTFDEKFGSSSISEQQANLYLKEMVLYIVQNLELYSQAITAYSLRGEIPVYWNPETQRVERGISALKFMYDREFMFTKARESFIRFAGVLELLITDLNPVWEEVISEALKYVSLTSNTPHLILEDIYERMSAAGLPQIPGGTFPENMARICYEIAQITSIQGQKNFMWEYDEDFLLLLSRLRKSAHSKPQSDSDVIKTFVYKLGPEIGLPAPTLSSREKHHLLTREVLRQSQKSLADVIAQDINLLLPTFLAKRKRSSLLAKSVKKMWVTSSQLKTIVDFQQVDALPPEIKEKLDSHFQARINMILEYLLNNFGLHSKTVSVFRGNNRAYYFSPDVLEKLQQDPEINWILRLDEPEFSARVHAILTADKANAYIWILNLFTKILTTLNIQTRKNFPVYDYLKSEAAALANLNSFIEEFLKPMPFEDQDVSWVDTIIALLNKAHKQFSPDTDIYTQEHSAAGLEAVEAQYDLGRFIKQTPFNSPSSDYNLRLKLGNLFRHDFNLSERLERLTSFLASNRSRIINVELLYAQLGLAEYYNMPDDSVEEKAETSLGYKQSTIDFSEKQFLVPVTRPTINSNKYDESPYAAFNQQELVMYSPRLSSVREGLAVGDSILISPTTWQNFLLVPEDEVEEYKSAGVEVAYLSDGSIEFTNRGEESYSIYWIELLEGLKPDHALSQKYQSAMQLSPYAKSIDFKPLHKPIDVEILFPTTISFEQGDKRVELARLAKEQYIELAALLNQGKQTSPDFFEALTAAADTLAQLISSWDYDVDFLSRHPQIRTKNPFEYWQIAMHNPHERFKCSESVLISKAFFDALGIPCEVEISLHGRYETHYSHAELVHRYRHARLRVLGQIGIDPTPRRFYPPREDELKNIFDSEVGIFTTRQVGYANEENLYHDAFSDFSTILITEPVSNNPALEASNSNVGLSVPKLEDFDYIGYQREISQSRDLQYSLAYLEDLFAGDIELPALNIDENGMLIIEPSYSAYAKFLELNQGVGIYKFPNARFKLSQPRIKSIKEKIINIRAQWQRELGFNSDTKFRIYLANEYATSKNGIVKLFIRILMEDLSALEWIIKTIEPSPLPQYRPWREK